MRRFIARVLLVATVAAGIATTAMVSAPPAEAQPTGDFDPGYIISDQNFYDGSVMDADDVQRFLDSKVSDCVAGYTCLKDYHQPTPTIAADSYCDGYQGSPDETAAEIIAKVGESCNISQRVLLVTLQKEQGLVTHVWPSDWRFERAMGYACSDSAPCDDTFGGFVYQVYYAARQFQRYAQLPTRYNYQAGRTNRILYHPNASCGSSNVYITNLATAGLYNYTPYRPNQAALDNLYGTGNSCSSYGNRNFWRYYWDWFGSPTTSNVLLRTLDSTTVYFIGGDTKYRIPSLEVYQQMRTLGGVGYVTQSYLDSFADGPVIGYNFRNTSGRIAMLDRGHMFSYPSCDLMADYGYACSADQYVQLTNEQMALFPNGSRLTQLVGTDTGGRYFVEDGTRREFSDIEAQQAFGVEDELVVLSDGAVAHLPLGAPIVSQPALIRNRDTGQFGLYFDDVLHLMSESDAQALENNSLTNSSLSDASFSMLPTASFSLDGIAADSEGTTYALTAAGRLAVAPSLVGSADEPPVLPHAVLALWPDLGSLSTEGTLLKATNSSSVYLVTENGLRQFASFAAYKSVVGQGEWTVTYVPPAVLDVLVRGDWVLPIGSMVRTPTNPRIYLVDGLDSLQPLSSFDISNAAGVYGYRIVSQENLAGYTVTENFSYGMRCDGQAYVAAGGSLHAVAAEDESDWPLAWVEMDASTCATFTFGDATSSFIRAPHGGVYLLEEGVKRPISSWSRWLEVSDGASWTNIDARLSASIPTGDRV